MDPRHLQALLPGVDVDSALTEFGDATGSEDPALFVAWLHEQGRIGVDGYPRVRIMARLDHPNILATFAPQEPDRGAGTLVEGRTLRQLLDVAQSAPDGDSRAALSMRLEHFLKVCDAVAYAHHKAVVHGDLKPANIVTGGFGEVFVVGWGIARVPGQAEPQTEETSDDESPETVAVTPGNRVRVGAVEGTPAFMAPEQAAGDAGAITTATDVCALGLILYELVTLRRAYGGRSVDEILERARVGSKRQFRAHRGAPPLEPDLVAIIDRATAVDPSARYESARALADDLRLWMRGEETIALPDTSARRLRRWMARRSRATLGIVAGLVVLVLLSLGWAHLRHGAHLAEERLVNASQAEVAAEVVDLAAEQAQRIADDLLSYEMLTERLASAAQQALQSGQPHDGRIYVPADFEAEDRAPADARYSERHGATISLEFPVSRVAPGVGAVKGEGALRRLLRASDVLKNTLAAGPDAIWVYVATEAEGAVTMLPGARGIWPDDYDPRTRAWYREAAAAFADSDREVRCGWSTPSLGLVGQGLVISCVQPFADEEGGLAGVAAVDLGFGHVASRHLDLPGVAGFVVGWLLDSEGRVMLTSESSAAPPTTAAGTLDFRWFPDPEVVAAVRAGRSGQRRAADGRLFTWSRLAEMDWTYVVAVGRDARTAPIKETAPSKTAPSPRPPD